MQCDENNDTLHQHSVFFSMLYGSKNSRDLNIMSRDNQLPEYLESGERARLIPVGKVTQRENRATSVLLAGMSVIHPFSKTLLEEIGQTVGSRSKLVGRFLLEKSSDVNYSLRNHYGDIRTCQGQQGQKRFLYTRTMREKNHLQFGLMN